MALLTHILIAVGSIAYTAYVYLFPSRPGLNVAYLLVGLTVATGTYLVLSQPVNIQQVCLTGLAYLAAMAFATVSTRAKLVRMAA